jgi:hypothetical protein
MPDADERRLKMRRGRSTYDEHVGKEGADMGGSSRRGSYAYGGRPPQTETLTYLKLLIAEMHVNPYSNMPDLYGLHASSWRGDDAWFWCRKIIAAWGPRQIRAPVGVPWRPPHLPSSASLPSPNNERQPIDTRCPSHEHPNGATRKQSDGEARSLPDPILVF